MLVTERVYAVSKGLAKSQKRKLLMRSFSQLGRKINVIGKYVFYYFAGAMVIILIFALIYASKGMEHPFQGSFEIFWEIEIDKSEAIIYWVYMEKLVNNLFSLIFVGTVLAHLLQPINPILFANYAVYDTVYQKMVFRYWIMLPKGQYLYNVKLRLLLTDYEAHQRGVNKINSAWEMDENEDCMNLNLARGIRYIELPKEKSAELLKQMRTLFLEHVGADEKYIGGRITIDFSIRGTNENGTTYHSWHQYEMTRDILCGYRFIPMQRHSHDTGDFFDEECLSDGEKRHMNASEDFYLSGKKEFFCYQYFDKVYRLRFSCEAPKASKNHDILSKEEIIHGQKCRIKQYFMDFSSLLTWYFLDTDRELGHVLKRGWKKLKYMFHFRRK